MADEQQDSTPQDGEQGPAEQQQGDSAQQQRDDEKPDRAGQNLDRDGLEKALRKTRDENAKLRARAKEFADDESYRRAKEALTELQKAEEAKKSEVEKLTERNEQLLYRSAEAEKGLTRLRVALGAGITPDRADEFASRLRGDTEDELRADAEQLQVLFQPATPERRTDPSQGRGRSEQGSSGNSLQSTLESKLGISR